MEACIRLEREMAKYRDLYESAASALLTTDARGIIVDANAPSATLLCVPRDVLVGRLLVAFVARRDTHAFRDSLRAILNGPRQGEFSLRIRPRGGAPVLAHLAVRAVHAPVTARADGNGGGELVALHWSIRVHPR